MLLENKDVNHGIYFTVPFIIISRRAGKSDKKKEHKDLLKKLQDANEQISNLQIKLTEAEEDAKSRSSKVS